MTPLFSALPIARYRFTAIVQQPLQLPDYAGSLLRGQFGAALRSVACMTRAPACPGCPLIQTCPYSRIFEAPPPPKGQHTLQDFSQIPSPYVLEPPESGMRTLQAGESLVFHLVLAGHALNQLALIVFALQRMLAQGLTRARIPSDLIQVDWVPGSANSALPIWHRDHPTLADHTPTLALDAVNSIASTEGGASATAQLGTESGTKANAALTLHIQTPLRLQHQGHPLGVSQLTPRTLVAAVARRVALIMEFHAGQTGWGEAARNVTHLAETLTDARELRWFDWVRYSSRQKQEMTLGGVLGHWTLHGDATTLAQIQPWLALGQWLHVGKNASFGMGGFDIQSS